MHISYQTIKTRLRYKRHGWGISLPNPKLQFLHALCYVFFLLPSAPILCFIRSSVSLKCKHCRIQKCPCLVAVWKSNLVTCSSCLDLHLFLSEIEHSLLRSAGSLKPQAPKRKSFSLPHFVEMCPARKELRHMFTKYFSF